MYRSYLYTCPTCGATKTIHAHPKQSTGAFQQELPDHLICGIAGCLDKAIPYNLKIKR